MPTPPTPPAPPAPPKQPHNPLHGLTLETIVSALVAQYGWGGLAERVPLRCFSSQPSLASSLKLLRKTPWAREKVESLYLFMLRDVKRDVQRDVKREGQRSGVSGPCNAVLDDC